MYPLKSESLPSCCRLGIDVGGTNTDAVILDQSNRVLAKAKSPTTDDVTTGVVSALRAVLEGSQLPRDTIRVVMLGTTHCTNAIATRQGLAPVGLVRLGAPGTLAIEPLLTWPEDLRSAVLMKSFVLHGGHEYNGECLVPLDPGEIVQAAKRMKGHVRAVAITGVFSPINGEHESRARGLLREELGDIPITLSSEIGTVGLLERENAAVLNATLIEIAQKTIKAFEHSIGELGITAPLFLGQNDGTLMSIDYAMQYPIFTVASGPSNSIRGAAFLSQLKDAIVVDVGGTTTDIGIVQKGFPRESGVAVEIGGVRTNFRMPDLVSIALGGGSCVHGKEKLHVGPDSVGYRITQEALMFGGSQLTATDLAVAAGRAQIGDKKRVKNVSRNLVKEGLFYIKQRFEESIDRIKLSAEPAPVVVVGGGSILFPDELEGAAEIVRPPHYEVANAIGVAIAQVSGMVDRIFSLGVFSSETMTRSQALDEAVRMAKERAASAGANPGTIEILEIEEIPLAYMPGNTVRIKVKAAGSLELAKTSVGH